MTPLPLGMVGGGQGAFIGGVHRIAAAMDGQFALVAGALSSSPERARVSAQELGLARSYDDYRQMARAEARRKDGIRAVAIVTPNDRHVGPAIEFLKRGIHVICDKPLSATLAEAKRLERVAAASPALFVLTQTYSGYPMIRQARDMVARGTLGRIRLVQVEYLQDWLTEPVEASGSKQAEWRTDPARSGAGGALGDIGTHALHLAEFVAGIQAEAIAADLSSFGPGRVLDDNAHILTRYPGGARGTLLISQVSPGNENGLRLRLYGERGGLEWAQEEPDRLWFAPVGEAKRLLTRGGPEATAAATRLTRVPAGHPKGYLEAFANIYVEAARAIRAREAGLPLPDGVIVPTLEDGMRGMRFIAAAVRSSKTNARWVRL